MDRPWWNEYGATIKAGPELWTTNREAARIYRLNHINGEHGGGLATRANAIRLGGNSGFQAVGLALHFGAARVILLGFDMRATGGRLHWHPDHKRLGNPIERKFADWLRHFETMARQLPEGVKVWNATRETALRAFKRRPLDECLAEPAALGP